MSNKIVFDIETQKTFSEVGGLQSNHHLLGVSFVGVYSYKLNKYFGFLEKDLFNLETILMKEKPLMIGFNNKGFDNKVLQPYFKKLNLAELEHLDILEEIYKNLGFRLKLESVAQATIGEGKSGTGLDAIRYYKERDFDSLAKYCLDDVRVTKNVYEYGIAHGALHYYAGGIKTKIKIPWGIAPVIEEKIKSAHAKHQRLKIKYFIIDEKGVKEETERKIDILKIEGDKLTAFCHLKGKQREFLIPQILAAEPTAETYAHQSALFA